MLKEQIKSMLSDLHYGIKSSDEVANEIVSIFEKGETIIEVNGVDWNIFQNLKSFGEKQQSFWKMQSNLREIMLKVDLSKKERCELEFVANQERSRL